MAESEELRVRFSGKEPFVLRDLSQGEISWPVPWRQGHEMRISEYGWRSKVVCVIHLITS